MTGRDGILTQARATAEDRQRALNELCRRVLKDFVGRKITPTIVHEVEATMRAALEDAVRAGFYVLPDGMVIDRVELSHGMRIQVYFRPAALVVSERDLAEAELALQRANEAIQAAPVELTVSTLTVPIEQRATFRWVDEKPAEPAGAKLKDRFEAVAAEINNHEEDP